MHDKIKTEIRAEIRNREGIIIKVFPWKRANSLLRQFIQIIVGNMNNATLLTTDTGGTPRDLGASYHAMNIAALVTETLYGIVIGTGTTAVTMTDIKLETKAETNIAHASCSAIAENPDAATWRAVISRAFTNNTGSLLTITEVGLYTKAIAAAWYFCIDRTLYTVNVPSGASVTLTYRITITL